MLPGSTIRSILARPEPGCAMRHAPLPGLFGRGPPNGRRGLDMHNHGSCNSHFSTETTIARIPQRSVQKDIGAGWSWSFLTAPWCSLTNHGFGATWRFCAAHSHLCREAADLPNSPALISRVLSAWCLRLVPLAPFIPRLHSGSLAGGLFAQTSFMRRPFHPCTAPRTLRGRWN